MSLLYRAIWRDDREDLCDVGVAAFSSWLSSKGIDVDVPDEGHAAGDDGIEVVARRGTDGAVSAVQLELSEDRPRHGEMWTTRLTAIDDGADQRWLWVDLERVADDAAHRPPLAAPRLARELIDAGRDARVDHVRIHTTARTVAPQGLAGLIRNQARTLPIIVIAEDPDGGLEATSEIANTTARRLAGAAQVMVLPEENSLEFNTCLGEGLEVRRGAARVFLPNSGPAGLRPHRHRYLTAQQMRLGHAAPAHIVSTIIAPAVTSRRPPAAYDAVRRDLRLGRDRTDAELLVIADRENRRVTQEKTELRAELDALNDELLETQADLDQAIAENATLHRMLQLAAMGPSPSDAQLRALDLTNQDARSMAEAVALARRHLCGVVVPDGVERDLDDLDANMNSTSWGRMTWHGLRALHLYAEADWDGSFHSWCAKSGHQLAWPSTQKKLALNESETVQSNRRLAEQRRLCVDRAVDPSGQTLMWAHLKIAEGGGPLAPRVYFHDDTRGPTGKVHVGFVGPHRYMENTRTN